MLADFPIEILTIMCMQFLPRSSVRKCTTLSTACRDVFSPIVESVRALEAEEARAARKAAARSRQNLRYLRCIMPHVATGMKLLLGVDAQDPERHRNEMTTVMDWDVVSDGLRHWDDDTQTSRVFLMHEPRDRRDICVCHCGVTMVADLCEAHGDGNIWSAELHPRDG